MVFVVVIIIIIIFSGRSVDDTPGNKDCHKNKTKNKTKNDKSQRCVP